jgi:hypothetical protein
VRGGLSSSNPTLAARVRDQRLAATRIEAEFYAECERALASHRYFLTVALPAEIWQEIGIDPATISAEDPWGDTATSEVGTLVLEGVPFSLQATITPHTIHIVIRPGEEDFPAWQPPVARLHPGSNQVDYNVNCLVDALVQAQGQHAAIARFAEQKSEEEAS